MSSPPGQPTRASVRDERIRVAHRLRDQGLSYRRIAQALSVDRSTVYRWCNPERLPHYLALTREWRAAHPERVAEYKTVEYRKQARARRERERGRERATVQLANVDGARRAVCPGCGGPMEPRSSMCRACSMKRTSRIATERRQRIADLWATGASRRQVAADLAMTLGSVSVQMDRMRRAGWALPLRKSAGVGRERREQVAA